MLAGAKSACIFRHFPRPSCAAFAKLKYRSRGVLVMRGVHFRKTKKNKLRFTHSKGPSWSIASFWAFVLLPKNKPSL